MALCRRGRKFGNDRSQSAGFIGRVHTGAHLLGMSPSTLTRLRCASDRSQHLLPYQATEWSDQHPIREKASPCRDIRAQYSSLGPKFRGAVRPYTHFEVPCRLRGPRRGGRTESNWAGCAQFSTGTPKATHCAEHEFFAGPLLKQSEAFREHGVESKGFSKQLVMEATPCLTRPRQKRRERTYCVEGPRYPPMVEVGGPQT
jgi:hypothetical protein